MNKHYKKIMKMNLGAMSQILYSVQKLLESISIVNYVPGEGPLLKGLNISENIYREWVKDIVDLQDFKHCYFVNGVTDAINQMGSNGNKNVAISSEGDYEYANMISGKGNKVKYINSKDVLTFPTHVLLEIL